MQILIGTLVIISSYLGACRATEKTLQTPVNQIKLKNSIATRQRIQEITDSITLSRATKIDYRDTVLYITCENGFTKKFTYSLPIQWERASRDNDIPGRIYLYADKGKERVDLASIIYLNCSVSRIPL